MIRNQQNMRRSNNFRQNARRRKKRRKQIYKKDHSKQKMTGVQIIHKEKITVKFIKKY